VILTGELSGEVDRRRRWTCDGARNHFGELSRHGPSPPVPEPHRRVRRTSAANTEDSQSSSPFATGGSFNSTMTSSWLLPLVNTGRGKEKHTALWARLMAELAGPKIKRDPNNPAPRRRVLLRPELNAAEKTVLGPVGYGPTWW
jgi:hypothetical protein